MNVYNTLRTKELILLKSCFYEITQWNAKFACFSLKGKKRQNPCKTFCVNFASQWINNMMVQIIK